MCVCVCAHDAIGSLKNRGNAFKYNLKPKDNYIALQKSYQDTCHVLLDPIQNITLCMCVVCVCVYVGREGGTRQTERYMDVQTSTAEEQLFKERKDVNKT